ncbi:MAG TPA: class II aldolase/adducin family protein [Acidimicrobiia bacterium]
MTESLESQTAATGTEPVDVQRLREDVVTCTKLLVYREVLDYSGHVSARIPGEDLVLIQPRDASRASLAPNDLLVVDLDGNVVEGEGIPVAETAIHTGVYRNRPDVTFVCHGHPPLATVFSVVDRSLAPVRHFAYKFPDGLAVHPDPTHIRTREQGDAVAATLGSAGACLLRSHGTVVVSDRIDVLFMDCLDLEENARTLLYASQLGQPAPLDEAELEAVAASYGRGGHRPGKVWEHYQFRGRQAGVL